MRPLSTPVLEDFPATVTTDVPAAGFAPDDQPTSTPILSDVPATINTDAPHQDLVARKSPSAANDAEPAVENCVLVAELGEGASGRAYLAQQTALANRPIVLKYTAAAREEHLHLARFQHTHIMPIYWASILPDQKMRVIAMPYLAKTTLGGLLRAMQGMPKAERTGERIFDVLAADQEDMPFKIAVQENAASVLKKCTWVEFVVRLGRTLAQALAYAHERDLLHLDIKPANILVTPDGQPILLDLDVARPPIAAGASRVPWMGGTVLFMSPEQQSAIRALAAHQPTPVAVDGRSDLYSLAVVMYVALGGPLDRAGPPDVDALLRINPNVSRELADILAHCLEVHPEERYPNCQALADDLGCYLESRPLRGVRNRLSDRWRKWRKRQPWSFPLIAISVGLCLALGIAALQWHQANEERYRQMEAALMEGYEWQRNGQHEAALSRYTAGIALAEGTFGADRLQQQLEKRVRVAKRLARADELHRVVHAMRFHALQDHTSFRMQHVLEAAGRRLWSERHVLIDRSAGTLEVAAEDRIDAELQELVYLWTDAQIRLAPPAHADHVRANVRQVLDECEPLFGASLGMTLARQRHGLPVEKTVQPETAWEYCALGRFALTRGDQAAALTHFKKAVALEPTGFVPQFYLGNAAARLKDHHLAVQAFSFCLGQNASPECYLLRGMAHAELGAADLALQDFDLALEHNPAFASAYEQRGRLFARLGLEEEACADLDRAWNLPD